MKTLKTDDTSGTSDLFDNKERSVSSASSSSQSTDLESVPAATLKGSVFTLPVIKLSTVNIDEISDSLEKHLASALEFFRDAPVVIDLSDVGQESADCDFNQLGILLKKFRLVCVAVQNGSANQHKHAINSGLAVLSGQIKIHPKYPQAPDQVATTNQKPENAGNHSTEQVPDTENDTAESTESVPALSGMTKVVSHPIRSGQRVYARGGDLILLAAVNAGAEIMADGNIHIYGPLRGRALAGVNGNTSARIFCQSLEAELVAIAGGYRVFEDDIPDELHKKSVQIHLNGEQLKITALEK